MKLLANGDSYTFGHGITPDNTYDPDWAPRGLDDTAGNYALSNAWPATLSNMLNCEHVNLSRCGGSNDRIVRTTINHIATHGHDDTLVIIGWSDPSRREIHLIDIVDSKEKESGWFDVTVSNINYFPVDDMATWIKDFSKYGWDDVESHTRYCNQVLLMQSFLESRKIPYVFFNSVGMPFDYMLNTLPGHPDESHHYKPLFNFIDWSKFTRDGDNSPDIWPYSVLSDIPGTRFPDWHPTKLGHDIMAVKMLEELMNRNIVTPLGNTTGKESFKLV